MGPGGARRFTIGSRTWQFRAVRGLNGAGSSTTRPPVSRRQRSLKPGRGGATRNPQPETRNRVSQTAGRTGGKIVHHTVTRYRRDRGPPRDASRVGWVGVGSGSPRERFAWGVGRARATRFAWSGGWVPARRESGGFWLRRIALAVSPNAGAGRGFRVGRVVDLALAGRRRRVQATMRRLRPPA